MRVNQDFDGGNIEVVSLDHPGNLRLNIRRDEHSEFYQWFYFELLGAKGAGCRLHILNAAGVAYPNGFRDYRLLYSYDQTEWLRHDTRLQDGVLSFDFTPMADSMYFAYFIPYSMDRHRRLVAGSQRSERCQHRLLGKTLDGQDIDLLTVDLPATASPAPKRECWIIARQHPGETMAEWWMEGCIERLLDEGDSVSRSLLERCRFHLVPNMNPDGSQRGHLRCNAAGRNLNREWRDPSLEYSPEVFWVKQEITRTGADFFLDVHGDESLPFCFIAGTEGLPEWSPHRQSQLDFYRDTLARLNPDFQTEKGYPPKPPGQANMSMSTAQIAHLQGCLAMTLEMPFKDTTATPNPVYGWSTGRCKSLAHSCLDTLAAYLDSGLM